MSINILSSISRTSGTNQNGVITLQNQSLDGTYKLLKVVMSNNIYAVNNFNNKIYFEDNGGDLTATLSNGTYTATELISNIQTQMDAVSANTYTVVHNTNNNKYTISTGVNFRFKFASFTANSARKLLGFDAVDGVLSTSQTSTNALDLSPYKSIYIDLPEGGSNAKISNNVASSIPVSVSTDFGNVIRETYEDEDIEFKFNKKNQISYKIHDDVNNEIDLNGGDWEIILKKVS